MLQCHYNWLSVSVHLIPDSRCWPFYCSISCTANRSKSLFKANNLNALCSDYGGTCYQCICDKGYRNQRGKDFTTTGGITQRGRSGTGKGECVNINECLERAVYTADGIAISSYCGENTVCSDTDGSYNCACKPGYEGDPYVNCVDINECQDWDHEIRYKMNDR